jgi:predicted PurR-regulated permease PerM
MIGIVLSSIMALITFGDFTHVLYVWGIYGGIQFIEGTFITPKILGDKVGLSPLAIIIAIFAGGKLFGLVGIFLAVPGATVVRVLFNEFHVWLEAKADQGALEV